MDRLLFDWSRASCIGFQRTTVIIPKLSTGVSQRLALGPLLFALYTWDISLSFCKEFLHLIYAADLQRMSEHAELVSNWARANNLRLNMVKTKAIVFGSYYYINGLAALGITSINLGHTVVKLESTVRSLGVILDSNMNWIAQVASICKRVYSLLYRLNFFKKSTNFNLRKHLIQSLLFPIVVYCSLVWCDISNELNGKIQVAMNAGIRYVFGIRTSDHITPYRSSLCWLTTHKRREYFIVLLPDVRNSDSIRILKKRAYDYFLSLGTGPTPLLRAHL